MTSVVVLHRSYGCDTGCCGHVVKVDEVEVGGFHFEHPYFGSGTPEERVAAYKVFARELVEDTLGAEHVADLDWENCEIVDD